jgi:flagellar motor protein MotB
MNMHKRIGMRIGVIVAVTVGGLTSCVTQEKYDDAQASAKHYQKQWIEQGRRLDELEAANARLYAELEAGDVEIAEAGYQIDERLNNLRTILSELGGNPGDVTKFQVEGGYVYRMKDSILFGFASSEVSTDGKTILLEVAEDINSRPHGKVFVRGHTDSIPVKRAETLRKYPHGNLQLSAARAIEVAGILTAHGNVDRGRVVVMGFGPSEPVAPNDNDDGRKKNRRVEIFVSDGESGADE